MKTPIAVTFDTNTYSTIANPQIGKLLQKWWPLSRDRLLSKKRRLAWWYIQRCIRKGRIRAGIPEAAFAAESLQNTDRVDLLLAVGTKAPRPAIPPIRQDIISLALDTGFRAMHGPRIGYGALPDFSTDDWAVDERYPIGERLDRMSKFIRHFNEYPLRALQDFGAQLSQAHGLAALNQRYAEAAALNNITLDRYLWREGIAAEAAAPRNHSSVEAFLRVLRKLMADWADFDIAATHYAYGYDLLCTEDQGKLVSNSIFGGQHATDVQGLFNVQPVTVLDLATLCWKWFGFPVRRWRS
jgi:hypothetical protein